MDNKLKLTLINDVPILGSALGYYDFYHKYISPTLQEILDNDTKVETIGLFGSWGSGKSTIIKNLQQECLEKYPVFTFDAWKYQADPLRRTFLINFFAFINKKELWISQKKLRANFLDDIYHSNSVAETRVVDEEKLTFFPKLQQQIKQILTVNPLITILFGATLVFIVVWTLGQYYFGETQPFIALLLKIPGILSLSATGLTALIVIAKKSLELVLEKLFKSIDKDLKTQTIIRSRDYLNSPEQFEFKFIEIVKRTSKKIVIVFDNIDRVQPDVAIEVLSAIKTFISTEVVNKVVFIVPCDAEAIVKQIKGYYKSKDDGHLGDIDPSEYLRKLFSVVIWTPDFINADLEDFTKKLVKSVGDDSKLLENDDLLLVINQAFKSNPREIIQFINNLMAALMIASKTTPEVWSAIKGNVAYLAKILVLRQKYPAAYKELSINWYRPENVTSEEAGLKEFLTSTSTITTENVEPFLYFKKPNQDSSVIDSEELAKALVRSDLDNTEKIILSNASNLENVSDYIVNLCQKYRNETPLLLNIFRTHLTIFEKLNINISQPRYFNRSLELIDRYLWKEYMYLPVTQIFKFFIQNKKAKSGLRSILVNRYVVAVGSKDVIANKALAVEIIDNLIKTGVSNTETLEIFRKYIQESYATEVGVIKLFDNLASQAKYLIPNTFDQYLRSITHDNFLQLLPITVSYLDYMKNNNLTSILVNILLNILSEENATHPEDNQDKRILFDIIRQLFVGESSLFTSLDQAGVGTLVDSIISAYSKASTDVNNKFYFIPILYLSRSLVDSSFTPRIDSIFNEFINYANSDVIDIKVIPTLIELQVLNEFIVSNLEVIKERGVTLGGEHLGGLYDNATVRQRQDILNSLITQRPDLGLAFISKIEKLPIRQETISTMIERINTLEVPGRKSYYDLVIEKIRATDSTTIKTAVAAHISSLLKVDSIIEGEIGYNLYVRSTFLSETIKRDIAKDIIDWLRTPGKVVDARNRFALLAVAHAFADLQEVLKGTLVYVLFTLLSQQEDKPSLEVALEILGIVKPKWSDYKKDYLDFKEKLSTWTELQNRDLVIDGLSIIKPIKIYKEQSKYWSELRKLKTPVVSS